MTTKIFKNLDEQVEIMKAKGLIITDEEYTKDILLRENYFFINGYRQLLMYPGEKKFIRGATFDELYSLFRFDRNIRNIFFKYILVVENNFKSIMSYQLSKKYGYKENDYLNYKHYTDDPNKVKRVHDILSKMKRQIRINGSQHRATAHYIAKYGYIPMWVLVKVLSLGIVSELYGILKKDDQISIAEMYGISSDALLIYVSLLANFRNICAHEDIFFDHKTGRKILDTKYHNLLDIEVNEDGYIYGKNDVYALIIIMKELLNERDFNDLVREVSYEFDILDSKIDSVPREEILKKLGFPNNWIKILDL